MMPSSKHETGRAIFSALRGVALTAVFISLVVCGRSWAADAATAHVTEIPRVSGVTVRAGEVADWKGQGLVVRALAGESATLRKSAEFEAAARLGWNEEGVLLQVEVTDSTPFEDANTDDLYNGDSVELYLMTADKSGGMVQLVASPGRTKDNPAPRFKVLDYRTRAFKADAPPFTPRVAVKTGGKGYVLEMLLPWSSMKIKPELGTMIGLRFSINDSDGATQQRAVWINHDAKAEWMALVPVRLAERASEAAPIATWGGYDEASATYVNAVAERALAGKTLSVTDGAKVLAQTQLQPDGNRAVAQLRLPFPALGETLNELSVQLDGQSVSTIKLANADKLRKDMFLSGRGSGRERTPAWLKPVCEAEVFTGAAFPRCGYPDPERIKQLVGKFSIETVYFDLHYNRVTRPFGPGRYGAVTTVIAGDGSSFSVDQTLYCQQGDAPPSTLAARLLAARDLNPASTAFEAAKLDRDWWHALHRQLGTATRYEYYVRLPKSYDDDQQKRWPVIIYLHGSGGGDNPNDVRDGGVQKAARERASFPFIAVSLRSPGGWYPPAVEEVIDAVAASCRTDLTRYYLTGFSMGGMGTWTVVQDRPERFAAIAVVGGRHGDLSSAAALKSVAAWVINGADDTTTTPADALKMVEALRTANAEVKYTEIPKAGHVDSYEEAYTWDEIYTWFLQHHR
jgi:predicted esterase